MDTLASHAGWWLELRCICGRLSRMPIQLLAHQHGPTARLPALVARMRCENCGEPPVLAELIDNPQGGTSGSNYPPAARRPIETGK